MVQALIAVPVLCALAAAALVLRPGRAPRGGGGGSAAPRAFCGDCGAMLGFLAPDGTLPPETGAGHRCR